MSRVNALHFAAIGVEARRRQDIYSKTERFERAKKRYLGLRRDFDQLVSSANGKYELQHNPLLVEVVKSTRDLLDQTGERMNLPGTDSTLQMVQECGALMKTLREVCGCIQHC